jgi:hypothetical protein
MKNAEEFSCSSLSSWLTIAASLQIRITFTVDVTGFPVYAGGVHIAGEFQTTNCISITEEWQPAAPGSLMALLYDSTYGIDVTFPESSAGLPFEWEFVRDNVWGNAYEDPSEGNPGDPSNLLNDSCANYDFTNRQIIIPSSCAAYNAAWNKCAFLEPPIPPIITQNGYVLTSSPSLYYQWQLNGINIPGATNQSYEVLQTGYYTVIISDEGNCVSSATVYVEITGIEDLISGQSILVTPNPAEMIISRLHSQQRIVKMPMSSSPLSICSGRNCWYRNLHCSREV